MKKILIFSFFLFTFSFINASAADICCLPGYAPKDGQCVYTHIDAACQSISSKVCQIGLAGYSLCSLVPSSIISNACVSTFYSAGQGISPSSICQIAAESTAALIPIPILNLLVTPASIIIYDGCLPIAQSVFNGLPDLGGLVQTQNLCNTGMGNRFYFCYINGDPNKPGIPSALGCIPYEVHAFISGFLSWSIKIGGGITFLVIIWGSALIITQSHDPKKVQAGQEMVTAAISGMLMIIICLLLINYLGDKVLNLGALGFRQ